jgi:hypothetical protein
MLFTVATEEEGPGLRLQLLDWPQGSKTTRIIPPIQERSRSEPVRRPAAVRLLDYLGSVPIEHRRHDLDGRIGHLAARLDTIGSSQGRRSEEAAANAVAAVQEAIALLSEIVEQSGAAIPGYGEVAVLLYELVHAVVSKLGPRL